MQHWLSPPSHVGAPQPADFLPKGQAAQNWNLGQGPISSATVNPYLKPIAAAELAAEAAAQEAMGLADQAAAANDGYELAFSKIKTAANRWRDVRQLALKIEAADDQQSTPQQTADMALAKSAVPGILQTAGTALQALVQMTEMLRADQSEKRPDLPPARALDPEASDGLGWGALAIAGGIVYLIWKAVF